HVKDLKKKRVPPLDDDLAKSVGQCESVRELREKVKKDLLLHKEREHVGRLKEQILDKLLAAHSFEPPESLVQAEVESMLGEVQRAGSAGGAAPDRVAEETARGLAKVTELARKRVRASLFLDAVAKQERLEAPEEEVNREVQSLAVALDQDPAAFGEMLRREERLEGMRRRLQQRKALEFLFQRANVVEGVNLVTLA
ncbi:MAG: trigger factor, partial [Acidobacteria bacterium]|nr:trigger factor [Acidobacteriota bacterium]